MNIDQITTMIQQYEQEGKDISTLWSDYQTLLSSGKTPIGLNQWVKTDKPMMEDFNEDNRVIDAAIRALSESKVNVGALAIYDLPLASGMEAINKSYYCKTGENLVIVNFSVKRSDGGVISNSSQIATLPVGFRPVVTSLFPIVGSLPITATTKTGHLYVQSEGALISYIDTTGANAIIGNIIFAIQ